MSEIQMRKFVRIMYFLKFYKASLTAPQRRIAINGVAWQKYQCVPMLYLHKNVGRINHGSIIDRLNHGSIIERL